MIKKLEVYKAKSNTITAFKSESKQIINSGFRVTYRLNQLNNTISEKPSIAASKQLIINEKVTRNIQKRQNL